MSDILYIYSGKKEVDGNGSNQGNDSGNGSSHSSTSNCVNTGVATGYESDDVDLNDEDLNDVNKNASLGNANSDSDGDLSTGVLELEFVEDSQPYFPRGYIDEDIVDDVMRNADERLNANKPRCNYKLIAFAIGIFSVLMIIIGLSLPQGKYALEKIKIEERIKEKSTAYEFDDRQPYAESIADETIEAGTAVETNTLMEYKVPLEKVIFPPWIQHYLVEPFKQPIKKDETPFFWQVPFAGDPFQSFMTTCNNKVLASNHKMANDTIMIHTVGSSRYVNVDLSTTLGIESAAKLRFPESGLADVIVSNKLHLATAALFDAIHRGRLFTAVRHPVDRSIVEYYYSIGHHPHFKEISLEQFANSDHMEANWMTRSLVNKPHVALLKEDLALAKEILRQRCVVGLHEKIGPSLDLFEQYFDWTVEAEISKSVRGYSEKDLKNAVIVHNKCKKDILKKEQSYARDIHDLIGTIGKESDVYLKIAERNNFDMELFWYANFLFEEQQTLVAKQAKG